MCGIHFLSARNLQEGNLRFITVNSVCIREWVRNVGCYRALVSCRSRVGRVPSARTFVTSSVKSRVSSVNTEHPRLYRKRPLSLSRGRLMCTSGQKWFCSLCTKVGCGVNPFHRRKVGRLNPRLLSAMFEKPLSLNVMSQPWWKTEGKGRAQGDERGVYVVQSQMCRNNHLITCSPSLSDISLHIDFNNCCLGLLLGF